jgi:threonine aldolase
MTGLAARKSFGSDNHAGTHPDVMRAIVEANAGDAVAYGGDPWTERAVGELKRLTGARGEVYLVLNGSGANVLGLGLLLERHEAVICAETAHINTDECGAAERILGTKLLTVPAPGGKLTPDLIARRLSGRGDEHFAQPGVVAVTQSTELGTCYSLAELRAIKEFCAANQLRIFLDGARLANAAAHLNCSVAEIASCADVLSFGGTKNGAMGVEAVVVMRPADAVNAPYLRKQHMQLSSKMRFLAAQFNALLTDGLWLRNAAHANAMATRLAAGLAEIPGAEVAYPVEADAVFARLGPDHIAALQRDWTFHLWDEPTSTVRWMTAFDTEESDVDAFLADIAAVTGAVSVC